MAMVSQVHMGWVATAGAASLIFINVLLEKDPSVPHRMLGWVDGPLLLMFASLFIVMAGVGSTGLLRSLWGHLPITPSFSSLQDFIFFDVVVTFLCNIFSNVPCVMLLSPVLPSFCATQRAERAGWMLLAWCSTVAGNFTLVGSIANLIVANGAQKEVGQTMDFWIYTRFGAPSTLFISLAGACLLYALLVFELL